MIINKIIRICKLAYPLLISDLSNFKIAKQVPFKVLVKRVLKRLFPKKSIDYSVVELRGTNSNYSINSILNTSEFNINVDGENIDQFLIHEFDLLGSGLRSRNSKVELNLHSTHITYSKEVLNSISEEYQMIDWQLDVKSNFRFREDKNFYNQTIDQTKNVDIKNCWELGRLQHFPQIALAAISSSERDVLIKEFKNQSIDFIGSNPVGMGVQWFCSMDVGIRVSNWLISFDILKQIDSNHLLDDQFSEILTDSIYQHSLFIYNHLEDKEGAAGNHYLFNLLGILFAANYLSDNEEILNWKKFAEQEIENEFKKQFFNDGGNFEGSTTYHCLSSEAMLYSTALMLRNGRDLNKDYVTLLGKSFQFVESMIKPNGEVPQFGDNDSGRLFKFSATKRLLNYESFYSGFSTLFETSKSDFFIENILVKQISKNRELQKSVLSKKNNFQLRNAEHQVQKPTTTEIKFEKEIDVTNIKLHSYEDFGLFIYKSDEFYLAISAICNKGMHHSWGHVHNDKLSFVLQVDGKDLVVDPGTYTYSSFPEKRNLLRSSLAHNGIVVKGIDQNKEFGLVYLEREVKCEVLEIKDLSITIQAKYYGVEHTRKFTMLPNQLIITDYCNKTFRVNINKFDHHSPNYGVIVKNN